MFDLRAPVASDAALRSIWFADPEVVRNAFFGESAVDQGERIRADAHDTGRVVWTVVDGNDLAVGWIQLSGIDQLIEMTAMIAYVVASAARGRGAGTAAVRAVSDCALRALGLKSVRADVLTGNIASRRVLARTGFVRTGRAATKTIPGEGDVIVEEWARTAR